MTGKKRRSGFADLPEQALPADLAVGVEGPKRSQPRTSIRSPSVVVQESVHADTPRFRHAKARRRRSARPESPRIGRQVLPHLGRQSNDPAVVKLVERRLADRGGAARWRTDYLPREVFFGRLGLFGVFFSVWACDFGRFFPATSAPFRCPSLAHPSEQGRCPARSRYLDHVASRARVAGVCSVAVPTKGDSYARRPLLSRLGQVSDSVEPSPRFQHRPVLVLARAIAPLSANPDATRSNPVAI